jgi:hypothetical protein
VTSLRTPGRQTGATPDPMGEREPAVLHLLIPGLLDRTREWQSDYGGVGRYPSLEWLLSRARPIMQGVTGVDATLARLFEFEGALPGAALRRLALTGERDPGRWLCMDPVHLEPGLTDLVLTGADALKLGQDEANGLVERINAHLRADGLRIEATRAQQWHLRLPETLPVPETVSLSRVLGRPVNASLPSGEGARYWHRLINELQMLLFDAPENRAREARGLPTVNSVWPWGGGVLAGRVRAPVSKVYGDDPVLAGLAQWAGIPADPPPESAQAVLAESMPRLVCLDTLSGDVASDDFEAWQAGVEGLERAWFAPLRRALGGRHLPVLRLHSACGPVFDLRAVDRWRFWRRPQPLAGYAP